MDLYSIKNNKLVFVMLKFNFGWLLSTKQEQPKGGFLLGGDSGQSNEKCALARVICCKFLHYVIQYFCYER